MEETTIMITNEGIKSFLYEYCLNNFGGAHLNEEINIESIIEFREKLTSDQRVEFETVIIDLIWLFDLEAEEDKTTRQRLGKFIALLLQKSMINLELTCERVEPDILEYAGILNSSEAFVKKQVKINTSLLYKQQKFNLLREEPEGYAKLIILLKEARNVKSNVTSDVNVFLGRIMSLIGYFDLDPNRVLEIVFNIYTLYIWENNSIYEEVMIKLNFPMATVASIIGFTISNLKDRKLEEHVEKCMLGVARLIKLNLCTLEAIYPHFAQTDEETNLHINSLLDKIRKSSSSTSMSFLSSKDSNGKDVVPDQHSLVAHEVGLEMEKTMGSSHDEKIHLTASLLKVGCFDLGLLMLKRFPNIGKIPIVSKAILDIIDFIIDILHFSPTNNSVDSHLNSDSSILNLYASKDEYQLIVEKFGLRLESLLYWFEYLDCAALYSRPLLLYKICNYGQQQVSIAKMENDQQVLHIWESIISRYLLTGLSLILSNPFLSNSVWSLLECYSYEIRFKLYGYWKNEAYNESEYLTFAKGMVSNDIKKIMRRLTKENVKLYGRLIAKIAHSNPILAFPLILDQIQAYENLIQPVVDSLKYLTRLDFDVICFILISALSSPHKDRLKDDGTNISSWLQGLASFTGSLFRKYYAMVDVHPILQYLVYQLKDDNPFDLIILSEVIHKMGGIESMANLSDAHVEALAGGPLLLAEVQRNATSVVNSSGRTHKKAYHCLITTLLDSHLLKPLWIALGRQRTCCIFHQGESNHLKLIGTFVDVAQTSFTQYSDLIVQAIRDGLITESNLFNDAAQLLNDGFGIESACFLLRSWRTAFKIRDSNDLICDQFYPSSQCPSALSVRLMDIFWGLNLSDIYVPTGRYTTEALRLKTILSSATPPADMDLVRWRRERERAPQAILSLEAEQRTLKENCQLVEKQWLNVKDEFFKEGDSINQFVNQCFLPRSIASPSDALFCAQFVINLSSSSAANWKTCHFMDSVANSLTSLLSMLTELEAHNFGKSLEVILAFTSKLHSSEAEYSKMASVLQVPPIVGGVEESSDVAMEYQKYRTWYYKLHSSLQDTFSDALSSKQYLWIRNAIIVLTHCSSSFPLLKRHSKGLAEVIDRLKEGEKREDLKVMAARYTAILALIPEGRLLREREFHNVADGVESSKTESGEIVEKTAKLSVSSDNKKRPLKQTGSTESDSVDEPAAKRSSRNSSPPPSTRQSESNSRSTRSSGTKQKDQRSSEPNVTEVNDTRSDRRRERDSIGERDQWERSRRDESGKERDRNKDRQRELRERDKERERERDRRRRW